MRISDWSSDVCSSDLRYAVVGALDRGATVGAFVQSQPVDLVILDLNLPDVRGINVLAEIVGSRDMTVIILTGETHVNEIHSALKLGARANVSKSDSLDHLVAACDAALAGEIYVSHHIGEALGKLQQIGRAPRRERVCRQG